MADKTTVATTEAPYHTAHEPREFTPRNDRKPKGHAWVWVVVLVAVLGGGYFLYGQYQAMKANQEARNQNNRQRAVPITATKVQKGDMDVYVEALGTVTPIYTVTITSRVQGQITDIHYREGQEVHKGDPLIEIDPRPYQAQLTQMQGQLAKDQAVLAGARIDLDRYQTAYSRNAIAKQQLDDQTQLVRQEEGTVQNDEGQVENARINLSFCHIVSPIEGRVGLRLVDLGNIVQANSNTPLVVVTQLQPITVIFSVAEDYLPQIQQQLRQGHTLAVDALDRTQEKKIASGTLLTIDNQVDTTTGTVKLRAMFRNADSSLFPNQFVNARLLVETQHGNTVVPAAAIQRNSQGPFVYLIGADQTATLHQVTTGVTDNNMTSVTGVKVGDTVATNGFDKLQDGSKVALSGGRGRGAVSANNATGEATP